MHEQKRQFLSVEETKRFYDRLGRALDLQAVFESPAIDDLIAHGNFEQANAVVEFGCGTGKLAARLLSDRLPPEARYTGLDASETMVRLTRARLQPWRDRAKVVLTEGAIEVPDSGPFDRFVCTYVLDLLSPEATKAVVDEAHRVLAPEGEFCAVSITSGTSPVSRRIMRVWDRVSAARPNLLGGCRPIEIKNCLPSSQWAIEHHNLVSACGVTSEIVIATPVQVYDPGRGPSDSDTAM